MPIVLHRQRPAMGTWFETWLVGDDAEHLAAVADAALDEVERVERLLSRFDVRSEVSRVNREAAAMPVRIDFELLAVLRTCRAGWERTGGFFDPTVGSRPCAGFGGVEVDEARRTVRFVDDGLTLDFGGFGKGYALDFAAAIVASFGVTSALLHGGTSSVLAIGRNADGQPWEITYRDRGVSLPPSLWGRVLCRKPPVKPGHEAGGGSDPPQSPLRKGGSVDHSPPYEGGAGGVLPLAAGFRQSWGRGQERLWLSDRALSCSSVFAPGHEVSDLIDPLTGLPLDTAATCVVLDRSAAEAEILSTALLAMGKARAAGYAEGAARDGLAIAWIVPGAEPEWLTGNP